MAWAASPALGLACVANGTTILECNPKSRTGDTLVPVAVTTSVEIEPPTGHPITYSSSSSSTSYAIILFRFLAEFDNGTATPRP